MSNSRGDRVGAMLRDTMSSLIRAQMERERLFKDTEKVRARNVFMSYVEQHPDWTQEDVDEVLGALGLV